MSYVTKYTAVLNKSCLFYRFSMITFLFFYITIQLTLCCSHRNMYIQNIVTEKFIFDDVMMMSSFFAFVSFGHGDVVRGLPQLGQ